MSRVVITDLVPGTEATSTDVNATISSWNTAGAAGAIGANNVRDEGIDRRSLSYAAQAIQAPPAAYNNCITKDDGSSGLVTSVAYAVINVGTDLRIGPMTYSAGTHDEHVVVRGSVWFTAQMDTLLECILQSSQDAVTWIDISETYQAFKAPNYIAANYWNCVGVYTTVYATLPSQIANRLYWRLAFRTTTNAVTFKNGTIFVEEYAR